MRYLKIFAVLGVLLLIPAHYAQAQRVAVGVAIGAPRPVVDMGVAPVCPYGYYGYYPYACAPYGFYGPDWFAGGIFIGAGPWYNGWGHPNWYRPGIYYGPRAFAGAGFYGRPGFNRPAPVFRGSVGGFRGGAALRGGGGFHGGGGHGGGRR